MAGRDLSAELFDTAPAQQASGGRDLSADLFGAPSTAPLTRTDKFVRGLRDPIDGGAQLLTNILPDGLVKAGNAANNWLADNTGLVGRLPEGGVDQQVREVERDYQASRKAAGESGIDGYRTLGNVLSPANLALASKIPAAASLAGRVGLGAATGAGFGALTPVGEGDFAKEKMTQVLAGGATGGALPAIGSGLARIVSPNASKNANLQLLRKEGVNPTIGQALGGVANKVEERLQSVPLMGDMISRARTGANDQFEAAAFNRALKPIGQKLPLGISGRDAIVHTENALRTKYDDTLQAIGAIKPDATFNTKLGDLQKMVKGLVMPKAEKAKFDAAVNDLKQSLDGNGVMTSDAFKALESSLGTDARKLGASTNIYEGKLAPAVKQLQAELRDMLQRQAGTHADDLKAANAGWANFKRVQNAAAKVGAEDGNFTPAQFANAVRAMDKSKDKGAFARGSALGQDLGDAGKSVLGSKVPNSGTPERMFLGGGALASGTIAPAIPLGLGAGAALYTKPVQQALVAAATARPQSADAVADIMRRNSRYLLGAAAPLGMGILGQ